MDSTRKPSMTAPDDRPPTPPQPPDSAFPTPRNPPVTTEHGTPNGGPSTGGILICREDKVVGLAPDAVAPPHRPGFSASGSPLPRRREWAFRTKYNYLGKLGKGGQGVVFK